MVDSMGSYHTTHSELKALENCNANSGFRKNQSGEITTTPATVQTVVFNALTRHTARINRRSHDKLLIVDGAYADDAWILTGGRNVSNDYYGIDDNIQADLSVFKDMEILLKPLKGSSGKSSPSQIMEYYYSILFSHVGNKRLTSWWAYQGQSNKAQESLQNLHNSLLFQEQYNKLNINMSQGFHNVKVKLAHEMGNLKSQHTVVSDYKKNRKANPNSILTLLKRIGEEAPNLKKLRIVSPYLFLEEY